jgi:hypothetical protein
MRTAYKLSGIVAALMVLQSVLGLMFPSQYRDDEWIRASWWGNDWVTLIVAVRAERVAEDVYALLHPRAPGHTRHDPLDDLLCQRPAVPIEQNSGVPGVMCATERLGEPRRERHVAHPSALRGR